MTGPSPRCRFQFRLRTLMIGVALFCVAGGWFAHEAHIASERQALRKWIEQHGCWSGVWLGHDDDAPSFIRRLLGDQPVGYVHVPKDATDEDIQRIEAVFPNANLLL